MYHNAELVKKAIQKQLEQDGPLDFLQLADRVAPQCDLAIQDVYRIIRALLRNHMLIHDSDFKFIIASGKNGTTKAVAGKGSRKAKAPSR